MSTSSTIAAGHGKGELESSGPPHLQEFGAMIDEIRAAWPAAGDLRACEEGV